MSRVGQIHAYSYAQPNHTASAKPGLGSSPSSLPSPPASDLGSTKRGSLAEMVRNLSLPTLTGHKGDALDQIQPICVKDQNTFGQDFPRYSLHSSNSSSKPVPNNYNHDAAKTPLQLIATTSNDLDRILLDLVAYIKQFKCPPELDFSVKTGSPFILARVEKNKAFIEQLLKLEDLRSRLATIPTQGDKKLEQKHNAAGLAIGRSLQRMKEHQLKLYKQFTESVESHLNDIDTERNDCVDQFEYPSKLDFPANSETGLILCNSERNKPFINQLRRLDGLRGALDRIPSHDDARLRNKRVAISVAIGGHIKQMKKYQLECYRQQSNGYRKCII